MALEPRLATHRQRSRWSWHALACGLLALVALCGYRAGAMWFVNAQANGGLVIPAAELDFGEVAVNELFRWKVALQNPSPRAVEILEFHTSCNCTTILPPALLILPDETRTIEVVLDLTAATGTETTRHLRDFSSRFAPVIKDAPPSQIGWEVKGRVAVPLVCAPPVLQYRAADRLVQGTPGQVQTCVITSQAPLWDLLPSCGPELGAVTCTPIDGEGLQFRMEFTPNPGLPAGSLSGEVKLFGVDLDDRALPRVGLPVRGTVEPDIMALPVVARLGAVDLGAEATETITLTSHAGRTFKVRSVAIEGEGMRVDPVRVDLVRSDATIVFAVSATCRQLGDQSGLVRFAIDTGDGAEAEVLLPVTLYGRQGNAQGPIP